jgi:hypothetical protein
VFNNYLPIHVLYATEKARLQTLEHLDEYEICVKLSDEVPAGNHVLTITPTLAAKIILAWVVMP